MKLQLLSNEGKLLYEVVDVEENELLHHTNGKRLPTATLYELAAAIDKEVIRQRLQAGNAEEW